MEEKIITLQQSAHIAAKAGDFEKAVQILEDLYTNQKVITWDIVFYRCFYQYARAGNEKLALSHINEINQELIHAFAIVLSQNLDILETLVCFQDIYEKIWDLSTRLQECCHREYIGMVKGKSITNAFYQAKKEEYTSNLEKILSLSENFINALGNLGKYTTINLDLIWDFFQCHDGLFSFLYVYTKNPIYEKKREENLKIIHLKRPHYQAVALPTEVQAAEIRNETTTAVKKKGFLANFFK